MRLIDLDKLKITKLAEFNDEYGDTVPVYGVAAEDIDNAPTVDAIVLPVKVGQTVYRVGDPIKKIYEWDVVCIEVYEDETEYVDDSDNRFTADDIGKTVFLTHEAAEAALKAREQNAD